MGATPRSEAASLCEKRRDSLLIQSPSSRDYGNDLGNDIVPCSCSRGTDIRSPIALLIVAYLTAFSLIALMGRLTNQLSIATTITPSTFLYGIGLGVATVLIEIGYIYAYKRGLPITIGGLTILSMATMALAPIGVLFFKDPLTIRMIVGALLAIGGVWLMRS